VCWWHWTDAERLSSCPRATAQSEFARLIRTRSPPSSTVITTYVFVLQTPVNLFERCLNISRRCGLLSTAPRLVPNSVLARLLYTQQHRLLATECCAVSDRDSHVSPTSTVKESSQSWLTSSPELTHMAAGHLQQRYAETKLLCWTTCFPPPLDRISRAPLRTRVSLSLTPPPKFHSATTGLLQF